MSELQEGLIGLGALGVLGVVAYNAWVAYRHRKMAGRLFDPLEKDPLFDAEPASPDRAPDAEPEAAWDAEPEAAWQEAPETSAERAAVPPATFANADDTDDADDVEAPESTAWREDEDARESAGAMEAAEIPAEEPLAEPPAAPAPETRSVATGFAGSIVSSASRWLGGLHRPRSGGDASSSAADVSGRERIEPALGGEAADEAEEMNAAWDAGSEAAPPAFDGSDDKLDKVESDDSGEFGEILESRPYGASEYAAANALHAAQAAPVAHEPALGSEPAQATPDIGEPMHLLSPAVDYIATLEAAAGAPAADWLAAQRATLARAEKPVHWAGFDEENGEWVMLGTDAGEMGGADRSAGGMRLFRHVRAGLQLADRRGALSDNDLLVFATAMDALAREWPASGQPVMLDLPDPRPVPAAAADLDAFCAGVDIQISLNVVALNDAFPGTKIRALAEAAGMFIDDRGRFVRVDDDGGVLYTLLNHDPAGFSAESMRTLSAQGLTFLLDVPTVARGERVFDQLVGVAQQFANVLKGALVDDNRRPLSEASLAPIRQQIGQFQARMAQRNLPAGGRMARRLFS